MGERSSVRSGAQKCYSSYASRARMLCSLLRIKYKDWIANGAPRLIYLREASLRRVVLPPYPTLQIIIMAGSGKGAKRGLYPTLHSTLIAGSGKGAKERPLPDPAMSITLQGRVGSQNRGLYPTLQNMVHSRVG